MEVLANTMVVIMLQYLCIKSTHCTPQVCTVLLCPLNLKTNYKIKNKTGGKRLCTSYYDYKT